MNARQTCNAVYALSVQTKDERERRIFDAELNADPERGPVSHGTDALAALFGGLVAPPPPVVGA